MNIVDREKTPNLILNLLYLRDHTSHDRESFGVRLNTNQKKIDVLLMALTECTVKSL